MTEKLKTLMDEAAEVDFATPDLDTIYRDGDKAVRRRRLVVGAAGLAAAAVTTGVVLVATGAGPDKGADAANEPAPPAGWAAGSVLHTPYGPVDVGHPVHAYVETSIGYVVADDRGRVWSVVGTDVSPAGRTSVDSTWLVGDEDSPLAAWVDTSEEPRIVAYDQDHHQTILLDAASPRDEVVAVDGGQIYVQAGPQVRALPIGKGTETTLEPPTPPSDLLDVEEGVLVWTDPGDDDGQSDYLIGRAETEPVVIPWVQGEFAMLSPDARWVTFDADEARVFDTRTGEQVDIDVEGRAFASGYGWVDEDSVSMIAGRSEEGAIELLVCQVPAGDCLVDEASVGQLGTFADAMTTEFALPFGLAIEE